MDAVINRNDTSVNLPLIREGGTPVLSVDWGKPSAKTRDNGGTIDPRAQDNWSGLANYNLMGMFTSSNAYSNAITLADLMKSHSGGTSLTLNVPLGEVDDNISCMPSAGQDSALTLTYNPGQRNMVYVEASLTRIRNLFASGNQDANTPTESSSDPGPIQVTANGTTVDITTDVTVTRTVGRPNSVVRRVPRADFPNYFDKRKVAHDSIELGFQFAGDNYISNITDLADNIFKQRLGRDGMTLDFNGLYGMGSFDVLPIGSAPFRHARRAGHQGQSVVPTFEFRRIYTD